MSLGADRVRLDFNPGNNLMVTEIKKRAAELIDLCDSMRKSTGSPEVNRCLYMAMTDFEDGAMWAVKAATA